jgi:sugar lactone lactonase YvrE
VFGNADLRTLFVTTARHRLSDSQLQGEPLAGSVLAIEPGIGGLPGNCFAG